MKDEYVAKVSHELRTPLTAIKEGIGLVQDGSLGAVNAEQADFLRTADESIDRLTELINNILDLAKIEAGRLRLVRRKVAVPALVDTLLGSYRMVSGKRRVEVEGREVPPVFADPNRIIQVLGNLFSNAVKFTPEEGTIRMSMRAENGQVTVSVSDNGSGIASEDLPKLFQKFSQVGGGQTRLRGTGLGLALCKELIELHRGTVAARSDPGQGSVFTFTLPVYTPEVALQESLRELSDFASRAGQKAGLLALELQEPQTNGKACESADSAEQVAEDIKRQVQQGDIVLALDARTVVVLAVADADGVRAMAKRLSQRGAAAAERFQCGWAVMPTDGSQAQELLARARSRATG
jgi:two-component sensor histidine kinase